MKRYLLPLFLVAIMATTVGGIGFVIVKYAIDIANQAVPFTYNELEKLQENDTIDDKELPRLLICLERNDEDLRVMAELTLAKMGKPAVEPLREKLKSGNARVRYCAVQTFAFMDASVFIDVAIPAELVQCMDDSDADVRRKAVYAIGRIGTKDEAVFERLIKALSDKDEGVAQTALEAIQKMDAPPKAALPALTRLARDPDHGRRTEAIKLLGRLGAPAAPAFKELVAKANAEDREALYDAILTLHKDAAPVLPELQSYMLQNQWWDSDEKMFAIFKACDAKGAEGLTSVLKVLHDPKTPFQGSADDRARPILKTLGEIGPNAKVAVPVLVVLLKEREPLRLAVLDTLSSIGPAAKEAIPAVEALTNDPAVGAAARMALKRLGAD